MNVCSTFPGNSSNSCWDISIWTKAGSEQTNTAIPGATLLVWLKNWRHSVIWIRLHGVGKLIMVKDEQPWYLMTTSCHSSCAVSWAENTHFHPSVTRGHDSQSKQTSCSERWAWKSTQNSMFCTSLPELLQWVHMYSHCLTPCLSIDFLHVCARRSLFTQVSQGKAGSEFYNWFYW